MFFEKNRGRKKYLDFMHQFFPNLSVCTIVVFRRVEYYETEISDKIMQGFETNKNTKLYKAKITITIKHISTKLI